MTEATMTDAATKSRGSRKLRTGKVVSDRMDKTIVVSIERLVKHTTVGRYVRRREKFKVHDEKNECKIGDTIRFSLTPEPGGDRTLEVRAAQELLAARAPFTALFAANDLMAMAAISVFGGHGTRLPQDLSVIGYDDSALSAYTTPALTTVRIPITEFTRNACRHLINRCYGMSLPVSQAFVPSLVWRGSVAPGPHPPRKQLLHGLTEEPD